MSNRTAIVASAVVAGCVSIASIASISVSTARAADECLSAPKGSTPAGGHWYYRLEKSTKRKCWYLADEGAKVSKPTAAKSTPTEEDASDPTVDSEPTSKAAPNPKKQMRKSVADARAELSAGATTDDPALADSTWPPLNEPAPTVTASGNVQAAVSPPQPSATDSSSMQSWTMASRWPEPNSAASANDHPAVAPPQPVQQTPVLTADRLVTAAATSSATTADPTPAAAPTAPAAVTTQPEPEAISIGLLLSVLVGVLALAAIIGPVIFNIARPRSRKSIPAASQRRSIWDTETPQPSVPLFVHDEYRRKPVVLDDERYFEDEHIDEPQHVADSTADEIEQLLSRASKRSAA